MARHQHADAIIAWANGAKIQVRTSEGVWQYAPSPGWYQDVEYRVMPETKKYRLFLYKNQVTGDLIIRIANEEVPDLSAEGQEGFVKWLTDWREIEI